MEIQERKQIYDQFHWKAKMVRCSRSSDKRAGRSTDSIDYITATRIEEMLSMQQSKCFYCDVDMLYGIGVNRQCSKEAVTIERIYNDEPHTCNNCVLACQNCNSLRADNISFDEMIIYGKVKASHKRCPSCIEFKTRSSFFKNAARGDGIQSVCKTCQYDNLHR